VADFSVSRIGGTLSDRQTADKVYGCADGNVTFTFTDRSWGDTVSSRSWTFGNGATNATSTSATVTNRFTQPGWVSVSLTANSNAGSNTTTRNAIYVADPNATDPNGYFQEFSDASKDQWPSFNFYNNYTKWEMVSNAGYYDNYSVRYKNYDNRSGAATLIGTPKGDYDDMFTPLFNLSGSQYAANCNLNFYSAGGFRSATVADISDTLEVAYSIDCGNNWSRVANITRGDLGNLGTITYELTPQWQGEWKLQSLPVPAAARTAKTMFRFRYKPGVFTNNTLSTYLMGSGNNFYMDRFNISSFPTGIDNTVLDQQGGIVLAPNPTTGGSMLTISGGKGMAQVQVTDVAGKVVYRTQQQLSGQVSNIEIPGSAVSVKGMYLVQVVMENKTQTQKLVVY
jgi:PKD repeat protein